jgi:hypothetical protein
LPNGFHKDRKTIWRSFLKLAGRAVHSILSSVTLDFDSSAASLRLHADGTLPELIRDGSSLEQSVMSQHYLAASRRA